MPTTATYAPPAPATGVDAGLDRPAWAGPRQRGHYEVWYLTLHDPASGRAVWLRHTLTVPKDPSKPAYAAVWAFTFDRAGAGVEVMEKHPLEAFRWAEDGPTLGPVSLTPTRARGTAGRVSWDLRLSAGPGAGSFRHVPEVLWRARLAGTNVSSPALQLHVSGEVEVGGERFTFDRAIGERGHVFGRRHADRWAWAHVHHFDGAPDASLEGVSAEVKRFGLRLPVATPLVLQAGGKRWAWETARSIWSPVAAFDLGRWDVEARGADLFGVEHLVRAKVTCAPETFVRVEYADPDGGRVWCNHTEVADAEVDVLVKDGAGWTLERRLVARGSVAFEVAGRTPDPRPRRRLDLPPG